MFEEMLNLIREGDLSKAHSILEGLLVEHELASEAPSKRGLSQRVMRLFLVCSAPGEEHSVEMSSILNYAFK